MHPSRSLEGSRERDPEKLVGLISTNTAAGVLGVYDGRQLTRTSSTSPYH